MIVYDLTFFIDPISAHLGNIDSASKTQQFETVVLSLDGCTVALKLHIIDCLAFLVLFSLGGKFLWQLFDFSDVCQVPVFVEDDFFLVVWLAERLFTVIVHWNMRPGLGQD
jgi:hypothetical protein